MPDIRIIEVTVPDASAPSIVEVRLPGIQGPIGPPGPDGVLADTGVAAGSYGSPSQVGTFTVDAQGRLTAAGSASIAIAGEAVTSGTIADARLPATVVRTTREVATTGGLTGGGNLSENRTLSIADGGVTLAKLAEDARAASNHTYDNTTSGLDTSSPQGAIDILAQGYRLRSIRRVETSESYTPDAGVKFILVEGVGAGGGGGGAAGGSGFGAAGGGGSGAPFRFTAKTEDLTFPASIGIGAGGSGGAAGENDGSDGGDTTFGSYATGGGGKAGIGGRNGVGAAVYEGGDGGDASYSGSVTALLSSANRMGAVGNSGIRVDGVLANHGHGGNSLFGAGGRAAGTNTGSNAGLPGAGYGAGGAGGRSASVSDVTGGDGSDGVIYIWEFI